MKRDREKGQSSSSPSMASAKGKKMWEENYGGGMDELLAVLGYKVKAEDMADVAQKLEQLEMVMDQEDGISLLSDSVHYNSSNLSGWVQSMLSELNAGQTQQSSTVVDDSSLLISADSQQRTLLLGYHNRDRERLAMKEG